MKKLVPLIVGNWKNFVLGPKEALALVKGIDKGLPRTLSCNLVICPPTSVLAYVRSSYSGKRMQIGAQNVSEFVDGVHTGEVSASMVRAAGATYAIVGHAERRAMGETDAVVALKVRAVLDAKMTPVVCIGESLRDKEGHHFTAIEQMLKGSLATVLPNEISKIVIAYEPVWAIGAATAPDARTVAEAILFIRKSLVQVFGRDGALRVKVLYGGAVDEESAAGLLRQGQASGFLVGRASADAARFVATIRACQA